jgi:hypothetical protein
MFDEKPSPSPHPQRLENFDGVAGGGGDLHVAVQKTSNHVESANAALEHVRGEDPLIASVKFLEKTMKYHADGVKAVRAIEARGQYLTLTLRRRSGTTRKSWAGIAKYCTRGGIRCTCDV